MANDHTKKVWNDIQLKIDEYASEISQKYPKGRITWGAPGMAEKALAAEKSQQESTIKQIHEIDTYAAPEKKEKK